MENADVWLGIGGIVFFAFSEIIGMTKWKSNSVIQLVLNVGSKLFKKKTV